MGIPQGYPEYVLHQMVTVMRGGEEVKISKRAGSYVTVRDLIDEVGRDAVRYFFLMRKGDSQLVFDVDLARSQSDENPVYYIQMAHARMSRHLPRRRDRRGRRSPAWTSISRCLTLPEEQELIKALLDYPALVAGAAEALEPHRVATYLHDTAGKIASLVPQGARAGRARASCARASCSRARRSRAAQRARAARDHRAGADVTRDLLVRRCSTSRMLSSLMTVLVVGSVALDSVETPFGKADDVLGGSATFFSASASHLAPVQLVGVVGNDYPDRQAAKAFASRRRSRRPRARGGRVVPLARPVPPRPQRRRDARDAPRRVLELPPEDSRAVPERAVRLPRQHRSAPAARRADAGRQARSSSRATR